MSDICTCGLGPISGCSKCDQSKSARIAELERELAEAQVTREAMAGQYMKDYYAELLPRVSDALAGLVGLFQLVADRCPHEVMADVQDNHRWHEAHAALFSARLALANKNPVQRQGADSPYGQALAPGDPLNAHQPNKAGTTAARGNAPGLTPIAQSAPATPSDEQLTGRKPDPCPVSGQKCRAFECLRIRACRLQVSSSGAFQEKT